MKLDDINPTGDVRLTPQELKLAYDQLIRDPMTKEEINVFAQDLVDRGEYVRSPESAKFMLNRMHILIHGIAPDGETQSRADTMFNIPQTMVQFVVDQGDFTLADLKQHVISAKEELAKRPVKVKKPQAIEMMSTYFMAHKDQLPASIKQHRDSIVNDIMNGVAPEVAFSKHM